MEQTLYTRWMNWRWRPANVLGRWRYRRTYLKDDLNAMTQASEFDGTSGDRHE